MIVQTEVENRVLEEVAAPHGARDEGRGYGPPPLVGDCVNARHPTLIGRVRVRWCAGGGRTRERWLPCLHGLTVREGDRVLVQHPSNWPEPIVVGVVDGFAMRPEFQHLPGPSITLEQDESVRVDTRDGEPLLEIYQQEDGPVVRLLTDDVSLELPGKLCIDAKGIELNARTGSVRIKAGDDVVVEGETIQLN